MTLNETNIIQKNSYYPFGLQHSSSWSRVGRENKYQFNAASELNEETQNYEMFFRSYDPVIGRMSGVDPYADSFVNLSPYSYAANDPIYFNDPSGGILMRPPERDHSLDGEVGGGGGAVWASAMERFANGYGPSGSAMAAYGRMNQFAESWARDNAAYTLDIDVSLLNDGKYFFGFTDGQLSDFKYWAPHQLSVQNGDLIAAGNGMSADFMALYFETGIATSGAFDESDNLGGNMEGTSFFGRDGVTGNSPAFSPVARRSIFDDEPSSIIPIYGDLQRAKFWAGHGDVSRTGLYTVSAASDVFLVKAIVAGGIKMLIRGAVKKSVLSPGQIKRIQNAASRINKPINLVGSRANGTAKSGSDWDYVIEGMSSKEWSKIKNSLPGARSLLDNTPRNIDVFKGKLNPNLPHIIF